MATVRKLIYLLIFLHTIYLIEIKCVVKFRQYVTIQKSSVEASTRSSRDISGYHKSSEKCELLNKTFNENSRTATFGKEKHLDSEKGVLQLTWTGKNHEKILLVTSDENSNTVWLSKPDFSFENITASIFPTKYSPNNLQLSLVQHPLQSSTNYLLMIDMTQSVGSDLFISTDSSTSYTKVSLPFRTSSRNVLFHPSNPNFVLGHANAAMMLYLSKDKGFNWMLVASNVTHAKWSKHHFYPNDIFVIRNMHVKPLLFGIYNSFDAKDNMLYRLSNLTFDTPSASIPPTLLASTLIKRNVYSIGTQDVFLYASIIVPSLTSTEERIMQVSTDAGRNWNRVQLPTITSDRFYSILDLSEGLIFLHVDNPGDTGRGVLYTSDATGILFSKSLENHLFPNFENGMDFYRVASTNGTFITSILASDDSVKSVISFDRGAEWHAIKRPLSAPCLNESLDCSLHIHNQFSLSKGINAFPPLSVVQAPGLIIAHGHVAESLQTSSPDVYVSNDAGHNWIFALHGPHHYQIAGQGTLLFAIPASTLYPDTFYFSTDGGRCWLSHKFTNEKLVFKELLVTPDNKENTLAIWAYTVLDRKWHSFVFDFKHVVSETCTASNYDEWTPLSHRDQKCVLGVKSTFKSIGADSWCLNDLSFSPLVDSENCPCTEDDYNCDYGYKRSGEICVEDVNIVHPIHICLKRHHQEIVPVGYHKIPGDYCKGGFKPAASKWINLTSECEGDFTNYYTQHVKEVQTGQIAKEKKDVERTKTRSVFYIIFFFLLIIATTIALVYSARKYKVFKRHTTFKYSSIRSVDGEEGDRLMSEEDENAVVGNGYQKIHARGPTELQDQHDIPSNSSHQQTGYVHPKLMALTNPHITDNLQKANQSQKEDDKSDVELLE